MNLRRWTYLLAAMAVVMAGAAQGRGRLDKIQSSGEIALGFRESSIPFSYLDGKQHPVGYSMDICHGVVEAVKTHLGLPELKTRLVPVTSSTRIPLVANGTVDISCGSATNNAERQKQVWFSPTIFVTTLRFASKKASGAKSLADLKGKTVVATSGTSNLRWLTQANAEQKLGMRIIPAKDHSSAFLTVDSGRAAAFFLDDVLLAGLIASSRSPDDWAINDESFSVEPYGLILPKDDPEFKKSVDAAVAAMMADGSVAKIYEKWFTQPIPPRNVNLNWSMPKELVKVIANPTDSPDPETYQ